MNFLSMTLFGDIVKPDLILWVEGYHDYLFFNKIIMPNLKYKYSEIQILEHSQRAKESINNRIKNTDSMNIDYLFIVDIDDISEIASKKKKVKKELPNIDEDKILVVIKEIESWYAAGLKQGKRKFTISNLNDTDNLTKQDFDKKIPRGYTKLEYLLEILDAFSIPVALKKNRSFNYCYYKFFN